MMRFPRALPPGLSCAIVLVSVLGGCASSENLISGQQGSLDPAILSHISPGLPSSERAIMYSALEALNPGDRDYVVYFTNDTFYVNDPSLSDGPFYYAPTAQAGVFESPSGQALYLPNFDSEQSSDARSRDSTVGAGVGPGYAVYSPAGYTDIQTTLSLPCADTALQQDESAYAYVGGKTGAGDQADIGLALTTTSATPGRPSVASPYLSATGATGPAKPAGDAHASIACGQSVGMGFYITLVNNVPTVVLTISGSNSTGHNLTIMKAVGKSSWTPQCSTCQVKYVTSLIQGGTAALPASSYFGITSPGTITHKPDLEWSNILVAPSYASTPTAVTGWTAKIVTAGLSTATAKCAVLHSGKAGAERDIGIDANCLAIPAQ